MNNPGDILQRIVPVTITASGPAFPGGSTLTMVASGFATIPSGTGLLAVGGVVYGIDPSTGNASAIQAVLPSATTLDAGSSARLLCVAAVPYLFDVETATIVRAKDLRDDIDNQDTENTGLQGVSARLQAFDGTDYDRLRTVNDGSDSVLTPVGALAVSAANRLYNDELNAFQRQRNNRTASVLALAARTVTTNSTDQGNENHRGLHCVVNVTVAPGGGETLEVHIQGKDFFGNYYDVLVGTLITTTGITVFKVYPGIGAIAGGAAQDVLPRDWRVRVVHSAVGSWTYSVGANLVV